MPNCNPFRRPSWALSICLIFTSGWALGEEPKLTEDESGIKLETDQLEAEFRKKKSPGLKTSAMTGISATTFLDKKTGFRDGGFGLHIVDWIMEPGSDEAYRDQLDKELIYEFNNSYHGKIAKRGIEGPQLCTQLKELTPQVIRGRDFVAIKYRKNYYTAAPGKKTGSLWEQTIVFPAGARYFISSDKITAVNSSEAMFLRIDMPGHMRHKNGDTFSEIYLSYFGSIPSQEFAKNFAPDERFNYRRGVNELPKRFIRAYHLRDPETGKDGPWLAGMTLDPDVVHEAWCHQRDYVCMIEEFGGRPIKAGESFSAAFIVGYFDSIEEMQHAYDQHSGKNVLEVTQDGWQLSK